MIVVTRLGADSAHPGVVHAESRESVITSHHSLIIDRETPLEIELGFRGTHRRAVDHHGAQGRVLRTPAFYDQRSVGPSIQTICCFTMTDTI